MSKKSKFTGFTDTYAPKFDTDFMKKYSPAVISKKSDSSKDDHSGAWTKEQAAILQLKRIGLHEAAKKLQNKKSFLPELIRLATNAAEPSLLNKLKLLEKTVDGKSSALVKQKKTQSEFMKRLEDVLGEEVGEAKAADIIASAKN